MATSHSLGVGYIIHDGSSPTVLVIVVVVLTSDVAVADSDTRTKLRRIKQRI